ncbi:hypothetical protein Brms1b_008541 [Colletotrichum noveboracense]|nr:hypothetical protein Brms1b_008541 [Colletotrichum noveboracense]
MASFPHEVPTITEERTGFDLNLQHGHQDLVQAVAFNAYGDRCATGSVDGKIKVFNRHKDGVWHHCDTWGAHGSEILELQWLPPTVYPNLIASLGIEGRFKLWAEDPSAAPGRRFSASNRATTSKAAYEMRSSKYPYRSFSMKHNEETRHTYLALLASDGRLIVYENEQPENMSEYTSIDEFSIYTPYSSDDGKTWSTAELTRHENHQAQAFSNVSQPTDNKQPQSRLSASLAKSGSHVERHFSGQPGQVKHIFKEIAKLDSHRTPVWRVGFDDDGQILASTGDDGKLVCYRQTPNGAWARSSELAMVKTRMALP